MSINSLSNITALICTCTVCKCEQGQAKNTIHAKKDCEHVMKIAIDIIRHYRQHQAFDASYETSAGLRSTSNVNKAFPHTQKRSHLSTFPMHPHACSSSQMPSYRLSYQEGILCTWSCLDVTGGCCVNTMPRQVCLRSLCLSAQVHPSAQHIAS